MTDEVLGLFGPLAKPECLRASRRGWLIWLRLLPAVGAGAVVFLVTWFWATLLDFDPAHLPYYELRVGLAAVAGGLLALAALIPPAVLAGSLAGEKERGSIALLLSTQASAADIVLSRWVGRLAPLGLVGASAAPLLLWLALLAGLNPPVVLMLLALPTAVALGMGGFALGVSAVSRRGRDALLLIYLLDVVLLLASAFAGSGLVTGGTLGGSWWGEFAGSFGLGVFNPFAALGPLAFGERTAPAAATALAWLVAGAAGLAVASWRLRPSCLDDGSGTNRRARRERRRWGHRVPPVGDRPMLWKELHIERAGSLGRVGRWVGGLLILWLALGSLVLGGLIARDVYRSGGLVEPWPVTTLANWYGETALVIGFLIQWAVGLRAGVAIASERERGTWDGLLTSPLVGAEIVRGKLWGSLHALRWLIAAALLAWTITWAAGGMATRDYLGTLAETALWGVLMAAAGVACSLRCATATRAMGATLGGWLGAYLGLKLAALLACLLVGAICVVAWLMQVQFGLADLKTPPWFPMSFRLGMELAFCAGTAALAALIVADTRLRFDRVAGRMTGGAGAVRLDELIHGRPMAPVRLAAKPVKPGVMADWEAEMMSPPAPG